MRSNDKSSTQPVSPSITHATTHSATPKCMHNHMDEYLCTHKSRSIYAPECGHECMQTSAYTYLRPRLSIHLSAGTTHMSCYNVSKESFLTTPRIPHQRQNGRVWQKIYLDDVEGWWTCLVPNSFIRYQVQGETELPGEIS